MKNIFISVSIIIATATSAMAQTPFERHQMFKDVFEYAGYSMAAAHELKKLRCGKNQQDWDDILVASENMFETYLDISGFSRHAAELAAAQGHFQFDFDFMTEFNNAKKLENPCNTIISVLESKSGLVAEISIN